jgi:hypothetical protein
MKELEEGTVENSELVEQTFNFWLNDQEHIRSPFPKHIHGILQQEATSKFKHWANNLHPDSKDDVNEEVVAEKFEEYIFETAMNLVKTEDEKLTITYPFLPRLGDILYENADNMTGESKVVDRYKRIDEDSKFLKVILEKADNKERWETDIELPE